MRQKHASKSTLKSFLTIGFASLPAGTACGWGVCPALDQSGDAFGPNSPPFFSKPDIIKAALGFDQTDLLIKVDCADPVKLPSQGVPEATFANIELDTDQNSMTGWEPFQNFFPWLPMVDYGAEVAIHIGWDEVNNPGFGTMFFFDGSPGFMVPVVYQGNSILISIPASALPGTLVDYGVVVGNFIDWTDALETVPSSCKGNPQDCTGDLNGNQVVDVGDVVFLLSAYNTTIGQLGYDPAADLNKDGVIDQGDFGILMDSFNCPGPTPQGGGVPDFTVNAVLIDSEAIDDPVSPLNPENAAAYRIAINGKAPANMTTIHATVTIDDPQKKVSIYKHALAGSTPWAPPDEGLYAEYPGIQHTTGHRYNAEDAGSFVDQLEATSGESLHWRAQWGDDSWSEVILALVGEDVSNQTILVRESNLGIAGQSVGQIIGEFLIEATFAGFGDEVFSFNFEIVRLQPGDVNGDGDVDVDDLLVVINGWGPCPPPPVSCAADVDGDGDADVDDLLTIINNWSN